MLSEAVIHSKKDDPLYASILAAKFAGFDINKSVVFDAAENLLSVGGQRYTDDASIAECVARTCLPLLGYNAVEHSQIYEFLLPLQQYYKGAKILFGILMKHQELQNTQPFAKFFNVFKNLPQLADVHRAIGILKVAGPSKNAEKPNANVKSRLENKLRLETP
uniref:Uncharacterized protein n=1 Tax=Panagrolaimus davidi TaxID=227884 RepID=A0A914Q0K4_9BILA